MTYGSLEANVLACMLIKPECIDDLIVEKKHFNKYDDVFSFFTIFYKKYKTLDVSMMFNVIKPTSELKLMETIEYLLDIFVIPEHFIEYQQQLIEYCERTKKEKWVKEKIYEYAKNLYIGNISIDEFNYQIQKVQQTANKIDLKKAK